MGFQFPCFVQSSGQGLGRVPFISLQFESQLFRFVPRPIDLCIESAFLSLGTLFQTRAFSPVINFLCLLAPTVCIRY